MTVEIYSKDNCIQCVQAAHLLKNKGVDHVVKKLDVDFTRESLAEHFDNLGLPQPRSFPMVFKDGQYFGGLNEVKLAVAKNTL